MTTSNKILTSSIITKEALRILINNLAFSKGVTREYDDQFKTKGAKIGDTINIRKPARYKAVKGRKLEVQEHTETSIPLTLDQQAHVDVSFTSKDLTLSLDEFSDRVIKPAVETIANEIDYDGLQESIKVFNAVGTPGTTPNALKTYLQAGAKMDMEAAPRDNMRCVVLDPLAQVEIVDSLKGLFQSSNQISKQYEGGQMGMAAGFKWAMDQNVITHQFGPQGGTPLVNGADQSGDTLMTDGWTASAGLRLRKGDVFTIAGVYAVNPQSRKSTGQLRQFVVEEDAESSASGNADLKIYPAIIDDGAFQTVTAKPADNAAITVMGGSDVVSPTALAYHKNAFVLGSADLQMPQGVDMSARVSDSQTGLSIRLVRQYDINEDMFPCRLDVLYGWQTVYRELASRIQG